jgi:hypothetical protein
LKVRDQALFGTELALADDASMWHFTIADTRQLFTLFYEPFRRIRRSLFFS